MASTPALVELTPDATENVLLNRDLFSKIGETCGTPFFASTYPVCKSWAVWVRELRLLAKKMDDSPFAAMAGGLGCTPRCPMPSKLWVFSVA